MSESTLWYQTLPGLCVDIIRHSAPHSCAQQQSPHCIFFLSSLSQELRGSSSSFSQRPELSASLLHCFGVFMGLLNTRPVLQHCTKESQSRQNGCREGSIYSVDTLGKGRPAAHLRRDTEGWHVTSSCCLELQLKMLLISRIFHLILSDCGWQQVPKTSDTEERLGTTIPQNNRKLLL